MRAGKARARVGRLQRQQNKMWCTMRTPTALNASHRVYGTIIKFKRGSDRIEQDTLMIGGEPVIKGTQADNTSGRLKRRCVWSHATAQARAINRKVGNIDQAIVVQSFDDANMWVQRDDQCKSEKTDDKKK